VEAIENGWKNFIELAILRLAVTAHHPIVKRQPTAFILCIAAPLS
jgi:hypothetical protein